MRKGGSETRQGLEFSGGHGKGTARLKSFRGPCAGARFSASLRVRGGRRAAGFIGRSMRPRAEGGGSQSGIEALARMEERRRESPPALRADGLGGPDAMRQPAGRAA